MVLLTVLSVFVLMFALVGCSSDTTTDDGTTPPADGETTGEGTGEEQVLAACIFGVPDPANGGGFERMTLEGVQALRDNYGWQVDVAENVAISKVPEVAAAYASKGYDIVFLPDSAFLEAWMQLPTEYPDTWFGMMAVAEELPESGKAFAVVPPKFGYGVLVGAVMSELSETKTIGLIGGLPIPGIMMEFSGIVEGCKALYPDVNIVCGWAGDYNDVAKHSEATKILIEQGADVVFTVTGPGYKGVWEACEAAGVGVVGYAYDSYDIDPDVIVGSVAYDGVKQFSMIADMFLDGTLESKLYEVGYDYIEICDFRGSLDDEAIARIDDIYNKLASGELEIPVVYYDTL